MVKSQATNRRPNLCSSLLNIREACDSTKSGLTSFHRCELYVGWQRAHVFVVHIDTRRVWVVAVVVLDGELGELGDFREVRLDGGDGHVSQGSHSLLNFHVDAFQQTVCVEIQHGHVRRSALLRLG